MTLSPISRLLGVGRANRKRMKSRIAKAARRSRRVRMEPLEDRRLLALLGVAPGYPSTFSNSTGIVDYDAASDTFVATGIPQTFTETAFSFPVPIGTPTSFNLQFQVDDSGNFSGNAVGDDFVVTGSVDLDFDSNPEFSGTLITGEVIDFGFLDSGLTDFYDLRLEVTGGALAAAYFTDLDIGLTLTSENSNFNGRFPATSAAGTRPPSAQLNQSPPSCSRSWAAMSGKTTTTTASLTTVRQASTTSPCTSTSTPMAMELRNRMELTGARSPRK